MAILRRSTGESLAVLCFIYEHSTENKAQAEEMQEVFSERIGGASTPKEVVEANLCVLDFLEENSSISPKEKSSILERVLSVIVSWCRFVPEEEKTKELNDLIGILRESYSNFSKSPKESISMKDEMPRVCNFLKGLESENPAVIDSFCRDIGSWLREATSWDQMNEILQAVEEGLEGAGRSSESRRKVFGAVLDFSVLNGVRGAFLKEEEGLVLRFWQGKVESDAMAFRLGAYVEEFCEKTERELSLEERAVLKEKGLL